MLLLGIPFGVLFATAFIASSMSYLLIDDEKISFPITRSPKLKFKRNEVLFSEIKCLEIRHVDGDGIITKDTNFYKFKLKSGISFKETLFSYGKKQEKEIVAILKQKVNVKSE